MRKKTFGKESGKATLLRVRKEMAKPRESKSVREEEANQATARTRRNGARKV